MWCIAIRNTCSHYKPLISNKLPRDSLLPPHFHSYLSLRGFTPLHFMTVFFLYLPDKTMDNNPGIAQRPANESNQAVLSWWRSGSLIKP